MTDRVILAEPCRNVDPSASREFGELVYLFPVDGDRPGIFDPLLSNAVRRKLDAIRFDATRDWLVVAGSSVLVATLVAIIAADYGTVRLLVFDAHERAYRPRRVERGETRCENE